MHALVLQCLSSKLVPGAKALDIGCGSGYLCAAMLAMMKFDGRVIGIEHIPELAEKAHKNIAKSYSKELELEKISILHKDGREGHEEEAPYDCICVGAAAESLPVPLVNQLKPGGIMVIPIGLEEETQQLAVCVKTKDNKVVTEFLTKVRYVPLTSKSHQLCRL